MWREAKKVIPSRMQSVESVENNNNNIFSASWMVVAKIKTSCEELATLLSTLYEDGFTSVDCRVRAKLVSKRFRATIAELIGFWNQNLLVDEHLLSWFSSELTRFRRYLGYLIFKKPCNIKEIDPAEEVSIYLTLLSQCWRYSYLFYESKPINSVHSFEALCDIVGEDLIYLIKLVAKEAANNHRGPWLRRMMLLSNFICVFRDLSFILMETMKKVYSGQADIGTVLAVVQLLTPLPTGKDFPTACLISKNESDLTSEILTGSLDHCYHGLAIWVDESEDIQCIYEVLKFLSSWRLTAIAVPLLLSPVFLRAQRNNALTLEQRIDCLDGLLALILNHRLSLDSDGQNNSAIVQILYSMLCPDLFTIPNHSAVLQALLTVAPILSNKEALRFIKRSLYIACLVAPPGAKWLLKFAAEVWKRNASYCLPMVHVNPSHVDEINLTYNSDKNGLKLETESVVIDRQICELKSIEEQLENSLYELQLLLIHSDKGIRQSANMFLQRILQCK